MAKVIKFPQAREGAKWFEVKNATEESADIYLYDYIGDPWIGSDAATIVKQLNALKTKRINLHLNSPGGSVFDGVAIYNALKAHPAEVTSYIDGLAASIASIIALAGKRVVIAENAMMMIHDPSALVFGDAKTLRKEADVLDQIKETLITTYVTRTGKSREDVAQLMADETWFTADEAISAKLADEKTAGMKAVASFDLSAFGYAKAPAVSNAGADTQPISGTQPETSSPPARLYKRRLALLEKLTK